LLDEPSSGLDVKALEQLESAVRTARAEGAAVLLVSHDDAQVKRLADSVTRLGAT
jgi:ABC-type sulfate/molybdate transport systems ATPase subunit